MNTSLAPWQLVGSPPPVADPAPNLAVDVIGWIARNRYTNTIVGSTTHRFSVWATRNLARRAARKQYYPRPDDAVLDAEYEFLQVTLVP